MYTADVTHRSTSPINSLSPLTHLATRLSSLSLYAMLSVAALSGCEADEESTDPTAPNDPIACAAAPSCGPDQVEVDACEEGDDTCSEVTICEQTVFCATSEAVCDAVPSCDPDSVMRESCEGAERPCTEVTVCGVTVGCEQVPTPDMCTEAPSCREGFTEVESCENAISECEEVTVCDTTIYCEEPELQCEAYPTCAPDEVESLDGCLDNGETCRSESVCGATIYCRPARDVAVLYCEETPEDAITVLEPRIEGDTLRFGVEYSGGCAIHLFPGCFADFQESIPVQVNLTITHETEGDPCDGIVSEERTLDLSFLRDAYRESYPDAEGEISINIANSGSVAYSF